MLYLLLLVAAGVGVDLVDRGLVVVLVDGVMRLTSVGILACFEFPFFSLNYRTYITVHFWASLSERCLIRNLVRIRIVAAIKSSNKCTICQLPLLVQTHIITRL